MIFTNSTKKTVSMFHKLIRYEHKTTASYAINYIDIISISRLTFNVVHDVKFLHFLDLLGNHISIIQNRTFYQQFLIS